MQPEQVEIEARPMLYVTTLCSMRPSSIAAEVKQALISLDDFLAWAGVTPAEPPMIITSDRNERLVTLEVAYPVSAADAALAGGRVMAGTTPGGRAARAVHRGSYSRIGETYAALEAALKAEGARLTGLTWEVASGVPGSVPDDQLVTEIFVQLRPPPVRAA
jgi:effector-binding domain-containing protein